MEISYIQDIVGNKKEVPVAPFAKTEKKNILAFTRKVYKNNALMQVNIYDYQAFGGKALCSSKSYTKYGETNCKFVRDKKGRLLKIVYLCLDGKTEISSRRRWLKQENTITKGYLTSIIYPNAKVSRSIKFSKRNKCIYLETINEKNNSIAQHWEKYDEFNRISVQQFIEYTKNNPAEINTFESFTYYYEDYGKKDSLISECIGTILLGGHIIYIRDVFSNYDEHGNWRTMHRYKCDPASNNNEELQYIEERVIAYRSKDIQSVIDAYDEAAYYLDLEQYDDSDSLYDQPF